LSPLALSLDPGIRGCGVGLFDVGSRSLVCASYVKSYRTTDEPLPERVRGMALAVKLHASRVGHVVQIIYEWPQVYQGSKQTGDPNDLTPLAGVDAAIAAFFPEAALCGYDPRGWKGQVNSNETARRILRRLSPAERATFEDLDALEAKLEWCERVGKEIKETGCKQHNTCDGVGIGLKFFGRFERERVYAR